MSEQTVERGTRKPSSSKPTKRRAKSPEPTTINTSSTNPNAIVHEKIEAQSSNAPGEPIVSHPSPSTRQATSSTEPAKHKPLEIVGIVSRTGTMKKTVAVRTHRQIFDKYLQKHWTRRVDTLVHDPNEILVEGDVVMFSHFSPEQRAARIKSGKKTVKFVLKRVITPFGLPLDQRKATTPEPLKAS